MRVKMRRLFAILLAVLMMSLTTMTSFAQTDIQLQNSEPSVEITAEEKAAELDTVIEAEAVEQAEEVEEIIQDEIIEEEPELEEVLLDYSVLEAGGVDITKYGKKDQSGYGGYLCISDSTGRGMGTSGDYSGGKPMEIPDVDSAISGSGSSSGILGGLVNRIAGSMIPSIIKSMNMPASLDFTKKYVTGSYAAEVAKAVSCDSGKVSSNGWSNKNTNYWPVCYVGQTVYAVNDLLNYDDGITDNAFTHGCCDIYSMFLYPVFGTNKSYSKVSSNVLTNYLKSNYRQNSGYETKASLISIGLGLNDVIVKAMTDSKICANPMKKFIDINDFKNNQNKYKNMLPAYSKALTDNEKTWEGAYEVLLKNLQKNNKNADYVLIGLYDPFEGVSVPAGFEALNTDTAAIVVKMNSFIKSMASKYGCVYVDISDTETLIDAKGYDLIKAGESSDCTIEFGFHPSQNGHAQISKKIIDALKNGEIEDDTDTPVIIEDDVNKKASYTVKHYREDLDGSYPDTLLETENMEGIVGSSVTPKVKSYAGFTAPSAKTVKISEDGKAVVEYKYTRNSYKVTVNKGTGIASVTGAGNYKYGAEVTLTATAADGYENVKWSGDKTTATFTMPEKNVTVTASATKKAVTNRFTVTFVVNNSEYGTLNRTSITNIQSGTRITRNNNKLTINNTSVTATPASSSAQYEYKFDNWDSVPSTVTSDLTITANFSRTARKYTITVRSSSSTMGTVSGGGSYEYGAKATITAQPKSGYEFTKWDDGNTNASREVEVTGAKTYTASFAKKASTEHKHSYTNWKSNNNGTHTGTCSCGETKTENCTYRNNVCTVCGYRKTNTQPSQPSRPSQPSQPSRPSQPSGGRTSGGGIINSILRIFGW